MYMMINWKNFIFIHLTIFSLNLSNGKEMRNIRSSGRTLYSEKSTSTSQSNVSKFKNYQDEPKRNLTHKKDIGKIVPIGQTTVFLDPRQATINPLAPYGQPPYMNPRPMVSVDLDAMGPPSGITTIPPMNVNEVIPPGHKPLVITGYNYKRAGRNKKNQYYYNYNPHSQFYSGGLARRLNIREIHFGDGYSDGIQPYENNTSRDKLQSSVKYDQSKTSSHYNQRYNASDQSRGDTYFDNFTHSNNNLLNAGSRRYNSSRQDKNYEIPRVSTKDEIMASKRFHEMENNGFKPRVVSVYNFASGEYEPYTIWRKDETRRLNKSPFSKHARTEDELQFTYEEYTHRDSNKYIHGLDDYDEDPIPVLFVRHARPPKGYSYPIHEGKDITALRKLRRLTFKKKGKCKYHNTCTMVTRTPEPCQLCTIPSVEMVEKVKIVEPEPPLPKSRIVNAVKVAERYVPMDHWPLAPTPRVPMIPLHAPSQISSQPPLLPMQTLSPLPPLPSLPPHTSMAHLRQPTSITFGGRINYGESIHDGNYYAPNHGLNGYHDYSDAYYEPVLTKEEFRFVPTPPEKKWVPVGPVMDLEENLFYK